MSSEPLAMSVRGLGKEYRIGALTERLTTLTDVISARVRHPLRRAKKETFLALRDVSFDVQTGEVLGVVGRNGAGKSTLLKILSRVTEPTTGEAHLYGRVGSLLEVGTGFHPELTGRENIYLNGAILGMNRREIAKRYDEIVEFSGIAEFLETPVKRYSSGMYVRLAFAVAAHLDPEILIVDEVLAVGDAEFQKKCLGKIGDAAANEGRTVLFVSHNMAAVEALCTRVIYLADGQVQFDGDPQEAISRYLASGQPEAEAVSTGVFDLTHRDGDHQGPLVLRKLSVLSKDGLPTDTIQMGQGLTFVADMDGLADVPSPLVGFNIRSDLDRVITSMTARMKPPRIGAQRAQLEQLVCEVPRLPLVPGRYWIELGVKDGREHQYVDHIERAGSFSVIEADVFGTGYRVRPADGVFFSEFDWELRPVETETVANGAPRRPRGGARARSRPVQ